MSQLSTEDRVLLSQSLDAFLRDTWSYETLRHTLKGTEGRRADWWLRFAQELGLLGLAQPETVGGMGGEAADLAIIAEGLGRHLVNEPFLQSVVVAGELLRDVGEVADAALSSLIAGETIIAPALFERGSRYQAEAVETTATEDGQGWVLNGRKSVVRAAPWANGFLVSARVTQGISLFLVEAEAAGLSLISYATFDGQRAADVVLDGVVVSQDAQIGATGAGLERIERALDVGALIQAAEAVGVMGHLLETTLGYVRQRRQFGQPIGTFQSLQHRLADMAMALKRADAVTRASLASLQAPAPVRARAVSAAKLAVNAACEMIGEGAVQLHGAIGLTEELSVSHAFKRVTAIQTELGDAAYHQERLAFTKAA